MERKDLVLLNKKDETGNEFYLIMIFFFVLIYNSSFYVFYPWYLTVQHFTL